MKNTFFILLAVFGSFLFACTGLAPNEDPDKEEPPVENRTKWAPDNQMECPQELRDWCLKEGHATGFPESSAYDYSDFTHTTAQLLIFDYWNYKYDEFRFAKLEQKETLHIFSKGSVRLALSKLSNKLFNISRIGDNLQDYDNEVFYTEFGNFECKEFIAMDNKSNFNLSAFTFDSIPEYFWMYLHETGSPDNTRLVWTQTDTIHLEYKTSSADEPVVTVNTCNPDEFVLDNYQCPWCNFYYDNKYRDQNYNSYPDTYIHKFTFYASENTSTSARSGTIYLHAKNQPDYSVAIQVVQAGKPDPDVDWVKVSAEGYVPYWYCPSTGETIPSSPRWSSDVSAFKNSRTGAYKVRWAYDEYSAHKGDNKIIMDRMYHSVYDSQYKFWKSCCDYYYYEFTIYE